MVMHTKRGIAMIELIFALVIMGIVLMSAPLLIQQSIKSGHVALQQEAIAAAASQTSVVLSMNWDENNNSNLAGVSSMLDVNRAPFDFDDNNEPLGLVGVTGRSSTDNNKRTLPATVPASFGSDLTADSDTNESDFTKFDDVDDYDNTDFNLTVFNSEYTTSDIGDYVDITLNMHTQVNYTEDRVATLDTALLNGTNITLHNTINNTNLGAMSNIKFIQVNLTSKSGVAELDKNITFQAFSCNIGTTSTEGKNHL